MLPACTTAPFLHQNQPSQESIFCGPANDWRAKTALTTLKFMLNILHNHEIRQ